MIRLGYHRPPTLAEALGLFAELGPEARFLAGGQTLLPTIKQRLATPTDLIDIGRLGELHGIRVAGDRLIIGAGETHAAVAGDSVVRATLPALAALAASIGDVAVRSRGTLGGSVANNDPAADYPAALLALDAEITTDRRVLAAADFLAGLFTTSLAEGEVVTGVSFAVPATAAYHKVRNPASRYAMAAAFVARMTDGSPRVAVTGAGNGGAFRWIEAEQALAIRWSAQSLTGLAPDPKGMLSDMHGSAAYRADLVGVTARRALMTLPA